MIPIIGQELKVLLGRIGEWPSDFGPEAAVALYQAAVRQVPPNGNIVDVTPQCGKTTILAAAAAHQAAAKVIAVHDPETAHPVEALWFKRAHKTFKLDKSVSVVRRVENLLADMIVVRNDEHLARSVFAEGLKPDGVLFGINLAKLDGIAPENKGNGWASWRKPKAQIKAEPSKHEVTEGLELYPPTGVIELDPPPAEEPSND